MTGSHLPPVPDGASLRCAMAAAAAWLLFFYFGHEIHYVGDDFTVLGPLFGDGLTASLQEYIRPLEYLAARLSLLLQFPVWLIVSFFCYVATACATLRLARVLDPTCGARGWQLLLCATTPLAAASYFQVDTVSQALANLFSLLFALRVIALVMDPSPRPRSVSLWAAAALAALCVAAKETSYGIVFGGACLLLLRYRRDAIAVFAGISLLLLAAVAWSELAGTLDISKPHYAFKANPFYWLFGVLFSSAVSVAPVATSLALTGTFDRNATTLLLSGIGAVLLLATTAVLAGSAPWRAAWRGRGTLRQPFAPATLMIIFLLLSIVPAIFFKVGELYASQMTPYTKALLLAALTLVRAGLRGPLGIALGLGWILASSVNLLFYSISSGYAPRQDARLPALQRSFYASIEAAVARQPRQYSVYSVNQFFRNERAGDCEIAHGHGDVCLPDNIVSGFPARRLP